jgi:hypothetical protein
MKLLCEEYRRKMKSKPKNKVKMLNVLMKHIEYSEGKGGLE